MATDPTRRMRRVAPTVRCVLSFTLALALAAVLPGLQPDMASAAGTRPCRVRDTSSGQLFRHLGRAIRAARPGHRLGDRGTAVQNEGRLRLRDVRVQGSFGIGIRNGGPHSLLGRSVVKGAGFYDGYGIHNRGRFVLGGSSRVVDSRVAIHNRGTLIMRQHSRVGGAGNDLGSAVVNRGRFVMGGASQVSGHGYVDPAFANRRNGKLVMRGTSSIHHNRAGAALGLCGDNRADGAGVRNLGTVVLRDRASIHHNIGYRDDCWDGVSPRIPPANGGGIYNAGTLRMLGSSRIHGNSLRLLMSGSPVEGQGGGVYNAANGTLIGARCGENVVDNLPDDCYFAE